MNKYGKIGDLTVSKIEKRVIDELNHADIKILMKKSLKSRFTKSQKDQELN